MTSVGQNDFASTTVPSSTTAAFVLGADPSPSRKGARRVSGISKIPLRPSGLSTAKHAAAPGTASGTNASSQQATQHLAGQASRQDLPAFSSGKPAAAPAFVSSVSAAGPASAAGAAGVAAAAQAASAPQSGQGPMFAVGTADGQPVGLGTPRGTRSRIVKHKPQGAAPTPPAPAPAAAAAAFAVPFSPIALTPMDENTYQKFGLRSDGMSPMDITPQGSVASSMASAASNVFVFSPLVVGGLGGQAAGGGAAGIGLGASSAVPMVSPAPFQGFSAAAPEASPSSLFPAATHFAFSSNGVTGSAAQPSGQPFSVSVGASGSGAQAAGPAPAGIAPTGSGSSATSFKFPIQIPIPGAREVQDMFSMASSGVGPTAPGSSAAGAKDGFAFATAPATAASGGSTAPGTVPVAHAAGGMAAAVTAAASKKLPDESFGSNRGAAGSTGSQSSQAGNDCQPAKDNAPKAPRVPMESSNSGAAFGAGTVGSGGGASGPAPSTASFVATAPAPSATAPAPSAPAAGPTAAPPAAEDGEGPSPAVLAALAEHLESIAKRAREAAAAAAVSKAAAKDAVQSSPAVRTVLEMMFRPGALNASAGDDPANAQGPVAAAVASLIGGLKLDDPPAGQKDGTGEQAATGSGSAAPAGNGAPAAAAPPAVPFVFGASAASSNAGSAGGAATTGATTSGAAFQATGSGPQPPNVAAPPPSVPFVFGAAGNSPAAPSRAAGATPAASTSGGMGSSPFQPFRAAPATAANASSASNAGVFSTSFNSVPFMFGTTAQPQSTQQPAAFAPSGAPTGGVKPQPFFAAASPTFSQASAGPSPMSTTPTPPHNQPPQQPTVSSSSGWTNVPRQAPAGNDPPKFTMGAGSSGTGAATSSGVSGTPGRSGRSRPKVTPRKTARAASSTPVAPQAGTTSTQPSAATSAAGQPAAAAPAAPSVGTAAPSAAFRPVQQHQPQQPQPAHPASQPQQPTQSTASADGGLDSTAVQAIRIKRSADEKKQYGNQKYEQSDFRSAERWYTEAIEALEQQLSALSLSREKQKQLFPTLQTEIAVLYSNRSGARLMTSKPQSALEDALRAMALDPKFMRAASRAATCHCRLGDFAAAHRIIDSAMDRCSASSSHYQDMLKKLNEVVDLGSRARAATAAAVAAVAGGAREKLQEAADQLAALRDQVAYCDVVAAARAVLALRLGSPREALTLVAPHPEVPLAQRAAPWRMWLTVQARYYRGDLQEALTTCRELHLALQSSPDLASATTEQPASPPGGSAAAAAYATSAHVTVPPAEALAELAESIQQQLKLKEDGNAAIKAGRHNDAAEHYTRALALGCPPAYAALLHANRAAAHSALGQLAEAVADCGRARALDPSYYKASARLASLMMDLRRPENAVGLLEPLVKLGAQADGTGPALEELATLKDRLNEARSAAKWMKTPHHYKMLGLPNTCSEEEVRKAYRRLALKHHPDKATASVKVALVLPGAAGGAPYGGPLAGGSELETRMREEASWVFNLINQAHEELSDKVRRRKVDQLLDVEQAPVAPRYTAASSASNPYANWFSGSRYAGFYGADPFFSYRPSGAAPTGSAKPRTSTGSGTSSTYGAGYGTYNASRPSSSRPSNGGAGASARPAGSAAGGSARSGTAAGSGYGGYGRTAGSGPGAGPRTSSGGRKWWEGIGDSDDDDQDTFNF